MTQGRPAHYTRRGFIARTAAAACGAGALTSLIAACGVDVPVSLGRRTSLTATRTPLISTTGGTSALKILMWQGPTILNPHLAQGATNQIAARLCCEPLLTARGDGVLHPVLAAEVPSKDNGGLAADGRTVIYKLKKDVTWADGQPFTADDVVFTYEYVTNPATGSISIGLYLDLERVEALDSTTVRLTFKEPTGGWYVPFTGTFGLIVPKHALKDYVGADARNAPFNARAFGTGPHVVEEFKPADLITMSANANYRERNKPFFGRLEIKGGGDAVSAARAVLETGEYDYAWNLLVEATVLDKLVQAGKGQLVTGPGAGVEQIFFNMADPNTEIDGERSSPKSKHAFLTDVRVREAMALAIDRAGMARQLFGSTGDVTSNILTTPTSLISRATSFEFSVDKANDILDRAGYRRGADGVRVTPDGVRMHVLYQTTINSLRQKEQALVKDGWQKIGIETELKAVDSGVFFSTDPGNPDTNWHFYADVETSSVPYDSPFPLRYMKQFYSGVPDRDWAQKANNWTAQNFTKWSSGEFNQLYDRASKETDAARAAEIFVRMNDLIVNSYSRIALVDRKFVDARSNALRGPDPGPFDGGFAWNVADWTRDS